MKKYLRDDLIIITDYRIVIQFKSKISNFIHKNTHVYEIFVK